MYNVNRSAMYRWLGAGDCHGPLGLAMTSIFGGFMKVSVKKKDNSIPVVITTEYIKLQDAMKYANIVYSGGEAKQLILDEQVLVNGEVCTMRGKKLRDGDKFTFDGATYLIKADAAE